jgi:hypothetical protein
MSKERETLIRDLSINAVDGFFYITKKPQAEIRELLAQPELSTDGLQLNESVVTQDLISDIEYLITAFEQGADADDYWRPISGLRDDLNALKRQVPVLRILEAFPLLDEDGLDEEVHRCEWVLQQDRKRLHAMLSKVLAQPEQEQEQKQTPDYYLWHDEVHQEHPTTDGDPDVYPLYASPPKREPLSDEVIMLLGKQNLCLEANAFKPFGFARAIEKAHAIGETNE